MPKILRFECFVGSTDQFKEQTLGTTPGLFQGSPANLDFAFFAPGGALIDLAGYTDVTLEVWENQDDGGRLLQKTIVADDFDLTATAEDWADKSKQPVRFALTGSELNFTIPLGKTQLSFYMVVGGTPVAGEPETLGYATLKLIKDRFNEPGDPVALDPAAYLTAEQSDARYATLISLEDEAEARDEADALLIPLTQKGAASGVATLDVGGKVPAAQLPALSLTKTIEVADEATRLALTLEQAEGKIVIDADTGNSYGLPEGGDPSEVADWLKLGDRDISIDDVIGLWDELNARVHTSLTISAAGLATGGGDLSANRTITVTAASAAQAITGTVTNVAMTPAADRAALTAYVDPLIAGRSPIDFAFFDGITGGRLHTGAGMNHAALAVGTGDITAVVPFRVETQVVQAPLLILGSSDGVSNHMLMVRCRYNAAAGIEVIGSTAWPGSTNTLYATAMQTFFTDYAGRTGFLVLTRTATTVSLWFDGALLGTATAANFGATLNGTFNLGKDSTYKWKGLVGEPRIINRLWSQTEVDYLKAIGRVQPADAFMGTMVAITSGTFRPGQRYRISAYVAGDDFTNVGGANVTGSEFLATGATPTTWSNASSVVQVGSMVALDFGWVAQARGRFNSIHGIATGGVVLMPTEDSDAMVMEWSQSATGYILGGQNPHVFRAHKFDRIEAKPTTATIPNITLRRNATSGGTPIVNAVSAGTQNEWTELTLNKAQLEGVAYDQYHVELSTGAAVSFRALITKR